MKRAVFLDRDGVINRAYVREGRPYPPANLVELEVLPGVPEALNDLKAAGFVLLVVTNQPDVGRGTQTRAAVEELHNALKNHFALPIDAFYACYHDDKDQCDCRKPLPGMLLTAAQEHGISMAESFMVGDRWRDILAGQRAGCRTIWIDAGYNEPAPETYDVRVNSLEQAAAWILKR